MSNAVLATATSLLAGIRSTLIEGIQSTVAFKLHSSGYVHDASLAKDDPERYTQLCTFGYDVEEQAIMYSTWGIDIMGYTAQGVITDACMGLATCDYEDMSTEQLVFAYEVALKYAEKLS